MPGVSLREKQANRCDGDLRTQPVALQTARSGKTLHFLFHYEVLLCEFQEGKLQVDLIKQRSGKLDRSQLEGKGVNVHQSDWTNRPALAVSHFIKTIANVQSPITSSLDAQKHP